jgi:folate-binding protein YgfZ
MVALRGGEALDFLQRLSTNDVARLQVGASTQTLLTNEKGRVLDLISVIRTTNRSTILMGETIGSETLIEWLTRFVIMENLELQDVSKSMKRYALWSSEVFDSKLDKLLLPKDVADSNDVALPSYVTVKSVNGFGEVLTYDPEGSTILRFLTRWGEEKTVAEFENWRVFGGIPSAPGEINAKYNPFELNLSDLVSFSKGCYIGQEVIARIDTYKKAQHKIARFEFPSNVRLNIPVSIEDQFGTSAGTMTSVGMYDGKGVGIGILEARFLQNDLFNIAGSPAMKISN